MQWIRESMKKKKNSFLLWEGVGNLSPEGRVMFFKGGQAWVRMHNGQIVKQNKWKYVEFIFIFCSTFMLKMVSEMSKRQKDLHWCFSFILLVIYLNAKPTNGQCCSWSLISRGESNFSQKFCISHVYSASFLAPFNLFPPFCKISIVILRAVKYSFKFVQKI